MQRIGEALHAGTGPASAIIQDGLDGPLALLHAYPHPWPLYLKIQTITAKKDCIFPQRSRAKSAKMYFANENHTCCLCTGITT